MGLPIERVVANALDPDRFDDGEAQRCCERTPSTRRSRGRCAATSARCASARSSRGSRELCEQEPARLALHPGGPDLERLADELDAAAASAAP